MCMKRYISVFVYFTLLVLVSSANAQQKIKDLKPTVILISLDGFRHDYTERYKPPAISRLANNGVRAKWMIPSFPTKTFPNHYTIVTGLYPQNHGIVENSVYDFGTTLTMSKREEVQNGRWWGGEPIWVTAEKQGQRAANIFWPGSEAKIGGISSSDWFIYNGDLPNTLRIDRVLAMLERPVNTRPTIITTYFSVTDDVGHEFGPDSEETKYAVHEVDAYIERLTSGLKKRGIGDKVNIIITSDHGMANYDARKVTFLDEHFDIEALTERVLWTSEIIQIFPKPGKLDEIYGKISNLPHTTCWKKGEIPARLHYNDGKRVAPIVCSSELGWMTNNHEWYDPWFKRLDNPARPRGAHGYDNRYQEMQATFIANGPAFKKGYLAEPFENIQVYNIMCKILGLTPAKNDGDLERVKSMMR